MLLDLSNCRLCPWECGQNRLGGGRAKGVCRAGGSLTVAKAFLHPWEEPCISGIRGSGTIFFARCNLKCVFCQNYKISQEDFGLEISNDHFARICLNLQEQGAHNINLVSPAPYLPQIRDGLQKARARGLNIPVVYNTNAFEKVESLREMEGLVDIYLPDLKYFSDQYAWKYSRIRNYFNYASAAVLEMFRQVGIPRFSKEGMLERGLLIRHLLMPGLEEDSKEVLRWIARELPREVYISLMGQFTPVYKASQYPELSRKLTEAEYRRMIDFFFELGLENGFVQELESSDESFIPSFDLEGLT